MVKQLNASRSLFHGSWNRLFITMPQSQPILLFHFLLGYSFNSAGILAENLLHGFIEILSKSVYVILTSDKLMACNVTLVT